LAQIEALERILESVNEILADDEDSRTLAIAWHVDPAIKASLVKRLAPFGFDEATISARAITLCAADLEKVESMLASAEERRSAMLHELACFRRDLADLLNGSMTIVEGSIVGT
jgi:hypothetical protein